MSLIQITDRMWYLPACEETDRPVLGYIRGDRYALQIDAGASPAHAADFSRELKRLGLPAPDFAILTHWHWDHTFGLCALSCPAIACEETREILETVSRWQWTPEAMAQRLETGEEIPFCDEHIRVEYRNPEEIRVTLPEITFQQEMTLDLGGMTARLIRMPATHSPDCTAVLLPEEAFVFLGDAPCGDFYGRNGDYDPELLEKMLSFLQTLPVNRCCTGHGKPEPLSELIQELEEEAQSLTKSQQ